MYFFGCLQVDRPITEGGGSLPTFYEANISIKENPEQHLYSTFIQKFIVLQRGYHHARRLNKMNKIKSNDVKKKIL